VKIVVDLPALAGHGTVQRVEKTCVHAMMLNFFTKICYHFYLTGNIKDRVYKEHSFSFLSG
jgi:hypothetical protein